MISRMKTFYSGFNNSWKAIKVIRTPKVKAYTQTSILEFFPVLEPVEESEEEEDDSFVVPEEIEESSEDDSSFESPNLFEETDEEENGEDNEELLKDFMDFTKDEISFFKEDGSINNKVYSQFMSCPVCDDCSFTSGDIKEFKI